MCLFRKKKSEGAPQVKRGLGRDFYSIFNDDVEAKAEANTSERETATFGRLFYDIFDDSVKGKKLAKEERHRSYMEQNRKSIISEYNGDNIRELSLLYRCSQSDIIAILRESIAKNDKNCLVNNMAEAVTNN